MKTPPSVTAFFPDAKPYWPETVGHNKVQELNQIAILVDDIDKAIAHFAEALGWEGPFWISEVENDLEYKGKIVHVKIKLAFIEVAGIEFELIQPVEGDTPQSEQLRALGPGLSHLRFVTHDIDGVLRQFSESGINPVFGYAPDGRWVTVYVNSEHKFGIRYELMLPEAEILKISQSFDYLKSRK